MPSSIAVPITTARAGRINAAHRKAVAAGRSMLAFAVEAGSELIEVKRTLKHGEFMPWVKANCEFSYDQAVRYTRTAKRAKSGDLANFDGGMVAFLDATSEPRLSPVEFTRDDAERVLKLAAMAKGGNANEEAVAKAMLDRMARRFGMTGEEAQAAAKILRPDMIPELAAAADDAARQACKTGNEILAAIKEHVAQKWGNATREELLDVVASLAYTIETIRLK
jgi:hypothetical protein